MTGDDDENAEGGIAGGKAPLRLRVVSGPLASAESAEPAPTVRLRREFKGLTVADLHREEISIRLPGQVRSALHHIERGDLDAAERALPGQFASVLVGPGHHRRHRWRSFGILFVLAIAVGGALATWLTS